MDARGRENQEEERKGEASVVEIVMVVIAVFRAYPRQTTAFAATSWPCRVLPADIKTAVRQINAVSGDDVWASTVDVYSDGRVDIVGGRGRNHARRWFALAVTTPLILRSSPRSAIPSANPA